MKNYILCALTTILMMAGCATPQGIYELKAYDSRGKPLTTAFRITAQGSGVYTARNALCKNHPKATITLVDLKTGQELEGESPYHCR